MHCSHEVSKAWVFFQNVLVHEMGQIDMVKGAEVTVAGITAKEERTTVAPEQQLEIGETGMKDGETARA